MDQEAPEVLEGLEGLEDHAAGHTQDAVRYMCQEAKYYLYLTNDKSSSRMCD